MIPIEPTLLHSYLYPEESIETPQIVNMGYSTQDTVSSCQPQNNCDIHDCHSAKDTLVDGAKFVANLAYEGIWATPLGTIRQGYRNYKRAEKLEGDTQGKHPSIKSTLLNKALHYTAKSVYQVSKAVASLVRYAFSGPGTVFGYLGSYASLALSFTLTGGLMGLGVATTGIVDNAKKLSSRIGQKEILNHLEHKLCKIDDPSKVKLAEDFICKHRERLKGKIIFSSLRTASNVLFWLSSACTLFGALGLPFVAAIGFGFGMVSLATLAINGTFRFFYNRGIRKREEKNPLEESYHGLLIKIGQEIRKENKLPYQERVFSNMISKEIFKCDPSIFDNVLKLNIDRMENHNPGRHKELVSYHESFT